MRRLATSLIVVFGVACAGPWQPPRHVCEGCRIVCGECEQQDRFVRLQIPSPRLRQNHESFTHPVRLRPEDWKVLLSAIHVQSQAKPFLLILGSDKGPMTEAFTEDEVSYLSKTLSQAMAQAQPNEWVVFGLRRQREADVTELTTGGWYVLGTELHLVLANYRFAVTAPSIEELAWENPLSSQGLTYDFVPGDHQKDVSFREELLRSTPKELSMAYPKVLVGEPVAHPPPQKSVPPTVPAGPSRPSSIKEQLQVIKELRDQGLITEQDYQAKKKQLLDQY